MRKIFLAAFLFNALVTFGQRSRYDSAHAEWSKDRKTHIYILKNPCIPLGTKDTVPVELVAVRNGIEYRTEGYVIGEIVKDDQERNGCGQVVSAENVFLDIFKHEFTADWKVSYDKSEFLP